LYIEGRIRTRSYDDKDGIKRYVTEIYGDVMQMLGSRSDNQQSGSSQPAQSQSPNASQSPADSDSSVIEPDPMDDGGEDDLPF
jgi:single-strand DNA-binding protein